MLSIAAANGLKNKNIQAIAISAMLPIVVGGLALAAQDRYTLKIPDGLAWSDFRGYETWQDVAVSQTETSLKVIAANMHIGTAFPTMASFFPTVPKLPRSSGPSKKTLRPPIS